MDLIERQEAIDAINRIQSIISHNKKKIIFRVEAADVIKSLPSAPQWIPCSSEPPKFPCIEWLADGSLPQIKLCRSGIFRYETKKHGVFFVDADVVGMWDMASRREQKKYELNTLYQNRIIAWMHLPEPYKGEAAADMRGGNA